MRKKVTLKTQTLFQI